MERVGLISAPFEEIVNPVSLKFKDPELERLYMEAQTNLKFLTSATRRYLIALAVIYLLFTGVSMFSDIFNAVYDEDITYMILDFGVIPVMILELIFYCRPSLAIARGTVTTVYSILCIIHNDYIFFGESFPYPCDSGE